MTKIKAQIVSESTNEPLFSLSGEVVQEDTSSLTYFKGDSFKRSGIFSYGDELSKKDVETDDELILDDDGEIKKISRGFFANYYTTLLFYKSYQGDSLLQDKNSEPLYKIVFDRQSEISEFSIKEHKSLILQIASIILRFEDISK